MTAYSEHPAYAFELINLINAYRAQNGVQPLAVDHVLMDLAQNYTDFLDATGKFSHTADGKYPWTRIAESGFVYEPGLTGSKIGNENLHYGYSSRDGYDTPDEALTGWINSSGHNRNMLNPEWDRVGIGYRDGLYTAEFGDGPDGAGGSTGGSTGGATGGTTDGSTGGSSSTTPSGAFGPSKSVVIDVPTEGRVADYARITLANVVDASDSRATVTLEALLDGKVVAKGSAQVPEPGAILKFDPAPDFDAIRVKAGETDVTGVVSKTEWTLRPAATGGAADGGATSGDTSGDGGSASGASGIGAFEQAVLALTNAERQERGLPPLRWNDKLAAAAEEHSQDMADRNYFSHGSPEGDRVGDRVRGESYDWIAVGENIAAGQDTPEQVVNAWMNSSGHRANILNARWEEIGVGFVREEGDRYGEYWTQVFADPDPAPDYM